MKVGDEMREMEMAWQLAQKIRCLTPYFLERHGANIWNLTTAQLCAEMNKGERARLEDVQRFARLVAVFLESTDLELICGCGYISMKVCTRETYDAFCRCEGDLKEYTAVDLRTEFEAYLKAITEP